MSKLDKMFEELGYKRCEFLGDIIFEKGEIQIVFDFMKKKVVIHEKNVLEPKLIQAIYQFCKEKGWLDE